MERSSIEVESHYKQEGKSGGEVAENYSYQEDNAQKCEMQAPPYHLLIERANDGIRTHDLLITSQPNAESRRCGARSHIPDTLSLHI